MPQLKEIMTPGVEGSVSECHGADAARKMLYLDVGTDPAIACPVEDETAGRDRLVGGLGR